MKTYAYLILLLALSVGLTSSLDGQETTALPTGLGISRNYPSDIGIGSDPEVLLHEDFETDTLQQILDRWESVSNDDNRVLELSTDVPADSGGRQSLMMTATLGENTGGHLYRRLPSEIERAFLRFYVKFDDPADYIHHFVHLGGYRPSTAWPQGGAGSRPKGDERFTVGIEPTGSGGRFPPPGTWNFYTYWCEMKPSADGRSWGNGLLPARPQPIPAGTWQCVEIMLQLNSSSELRDGELALWIDGELQMHIAPGRPRTEWTGMGFAVLEEGGEPFEGFRWRTTDELKINFVWLLHYVTEQAARQNQVQNPQAKNRVWFDDIVIATEYIGPIN